MKLFFIFIATHNQLGSTDLEYFSCGYISKIFSPTVMQWVNSPEGEQSLRENIDLLHYHHQHSVDGGLLNRFIEAMGEKTPQELILEEV